MADGGPTEQKVVLPLSELYSLSFPEVGSTAAFLLLHVHWMYAELQECGRAGRWSMDDESWTTFPGFMALLLGPWTLDLSFLEEK